MVTMILNFFHSRAFSTKISFFSSSSFSKSSSPYIEGVKQGVEQGWSRGRGSWFPPPLSLTHSAVLLFPTSVNAHCRPRPTLVALWSGVQSLHSSLRWGGEREGEHTAEVQNRLRPPLPPGILHKFIEFFPNLLQSLHLLPSVHELQGQRHPQLSPLQVAEGPSDTPKGGGALGRQARLDVLAASQDQVPDPFHLETAHKVSLV